MTDVAEQPARDVLHLSEEEVLRPDASDGAAAGQDADAPGLKALSNIEPGFSARRRAVVIVDATEASAAATQWAVKHWWSAGDAVHLVHAVCCLLPNLEIYHSGPGNAYKFQAPEAHHERKDVLAAQAFIESRHLPFMDALGVPYEVHMFVDTLNAPPDAIGGTAFRVAEQLGASLLVTTTDCYRLPIVFVRPPIVAAEMDLDQPNTGAAAAANALADAPPDAKLAVV